MEATKGSSPAIDFKGSGNNLTGKDPKPSTGSLSNSESKNNDNINNNETQLKTTTDGANGIQVINTRSNDEREKFQKLDSISIINSAPLVAPASKESKVPTVDKRATSKYDTTLPPIISQDDATALKSEGFTNQPFSAVRTIPASGLDTNVIKSLDSVNTHLHQQKQNKVTQNNQQHHQYQIAVENHHHHGGATQHLSHNHNTNSEQLSKTNLYIRGLGPETSDSDLYSMCSRFGSIVSTKAILDKSTNKCKGYGFVDFENPAAAEVAVAELQKQGILVHMAKQQEADPTNLYMANLPQTMTESDLDNLLRPYGQVVSTRILINQNRQPRGVGFARMETKEQCDSIIASLNGKVIKGSAEPLLVKFADGANKKRPHHFQHKPIGSNSFLGSHMRRNNGNDTNHYHMINSGTSSSRNFHNGSFSEHSRQNHSLSHHDNGLIKHQQLLNSMPGYHAHHQSSGHHPYMLQQPQMMTPTSAIDPSMHYVNLANQMQGLQISNHPVSGYLSPQWQPVWPPGGSSAFSNTSTSSRDTILR